MISVEHCEYVWRCFIVLTRLLLCHARYTQMSTCVKLVLRYFIFSHHERKFLPVITKLPAWRTRSTLWGLVNRSGGGGDAGVHRGLLSNDCLPVNWERSKETMKWKRKHSAVSFVIAGFMTHVLTSFQTWIYFKDSREERVCMLEFVESDNRRGAKNW